MEDFQAWVLAVRKAVCPNAPASFSRLLTGWGSHLVRGISIQDSSSARIPSVKPNWVSFVTVVSDATAANRYLQLTKYSNQKWKLSNGQIIWVKSILSPRLAKSMEISPKLGNLAKPTRSCMARICPWITWKGKWVVRIRTSLKKFWTKIDKNSWKWTNRFSEKLRLEI